MQYPFHIVVIPLGLLLDFPAIITHEILEVPLSYLNDLVGRERFRPGSLSTFQLNTNSIMGCVKMLPEAAQWRFGS